jgi:hypothetical protein
MAGKIYNYFLKAGETGGAKATVKLSVLTGVNSAQAISIPDSEENVRIFEEAMKRIEKEFGGRSTVRTSTGNTGYEQTNKQDELSGNLKAHLNLLSYLIA